MALIKAAVIPLALILFIVPGAFSQAHPVLFSAEIAALEKKAADPASTPAERKLVLEQAARLLELSGNAGRAAEIWREAAIAVPGGQGDLANLLQSGRCLAAIGEFDKVDDALKPVLASSDKALLTKARLLAAWIDAFRTGRTDALNALLSNPDFADYKPGIYYTIWRISGNSSGAAARLLAEFPQSPEARIIRNDGPVSAAPAALWLLGISGEHITGQPVPAAQPVQEPPSGGGPLMLQTGLFSREENAQALAERLRNAGFVPVVSKRTINGKEHWAVGVRPGADLSQTTLLLKDKGFESFPVY